MPHSKLSIAFHLRRLHARARQGIARIGLGPDTFLVLISVVIGAATGLFAHLFFFLIEQARHFAFGGGAEEGLFAGQTWMLVVLPAVGGLVVGLITHYFAREASGHGVPEVLDAIYRSGGLIRARVAVAKAVASALTIGSGGSAGMEGPIIQIGAAIGSNAGRALKVSPSHVNIVIACGVSAGIAAIFNAPIAGVLFSLEIFLRDFSFRTFSPVVFSSVVSCSVIHAIRARDVAIFEVAVLRDAGYVFVGYELPLYLVLGLLCALAAAAFIRVLYLTEDVFEKIKIYGPLRPMLGAAGLGLTGLAYVALTGSSAVPPFYGNGYPAIEAIVGSSLFTLTVGGMLGLLAAKLLVTSLTLGSGGSGGIFAPSLLIGASLGGAFGLTLTHAGLIQPTSASAYALVGMAAVVAATTHAPLMAIVMLYEITREPKVILPVMFAAIVATAGARLLCRDSIYTLKLRRRGVRVGTAADLTVLRRIRVADVPHLPAPHVHAEDPLQTLISLASQTEAVDFVVVDENNAYCGMVTGEDVRTALLQPEAVSLLVVGELVRTGVPTVSMDETLDTLLDKFAQADVESLPVADPKDDMRVSSLVTRRAVIRRYRAELDRSDR